MPATFDKILGKPLLHTHQVSDIVGGGPGADEVILSDASSGNVTVNLPSLSGVIGKKYIIKKIDSSSNTVTIVADGTDKIENIIQNIIIEFQNTSVQLTATATSWFII